jgi:PTS system fructose-specific IIC component
MKVSNYLKEDFCIMELNTGDKQEVIRQLAQKMSVSGAIVDGEKFIKDVLGREVLGSTGIGNGIAIPHARTEAVKGFAIGFGRAREGIDFNAIDHEPVKLIFLMGASHKELNLYLRMLAELSKLLMNSAFRNELLSAATASDVIHIIRKFEATPGAS